ncbi:polysaccharide deacetylase family protein [Algoriphagus halophytocola]|uniref:Polysaccharide deacetylase family protein n=1 Tax=Algoriphagus halophytocola TaxID=2991499 RepID=A0ABY6MG30_9BACT|nr:MULTISPECIES: polysaccharide deacetylase family protein [unclassified Algoriphagus]UZD22593.1 polysaccharide deacetylase family protein [Algoriphagus sp. TR-M5]WBL43859.1 polysaccharide deacetylase family protein [Algoriphagus sp. TR-M9]
MRNQFLISIIFLLISLPGESQIIKKPIPNKLVVLTFDDAPASHYSVAAPMLKEMGFGATFFVCEFPPNYPDSSLYMNWRQVQALDRMGFEIANHTHTHANVTKLTQKEFDRELQYIEHKCAALGIPIPRNFAYPGYGLHAESLKLLEARAYDFARAGGSRVYDPTSDHPYLIPSWATDENNQDEIMAAFQQAKNGKIVVLTIHGVPDLEHPWVNTPPALFQSYLDFLKSENYQVISLGQLREFIDPEEARLAIEPNFDRPLSN